MSHVDMLLNMHVVIFRGSTAEAIRNGKGGRAAGQLGGTCACRALSQAQAVPHAWYLHACMPALALGMRAHPPVAEGPGMRSAPQAAFIQLHPRVRAVRRAALSPNRKFVAAVEELHPEGGDEQQQARGRYAGARLRAGQRGGSARARHLCSACLES